MKNIYCDISATTPISPKVQEFMSEIQSTVYGNPSSIHRFGQESKAIIEQARRQIANILNCQPGEIYFTGCGSESNNIALHGILKIGDHLITSTYEHPAIKKPVSALETSGITVTRIQPGNDGRIPPDSVKNAMTPETRLVSIMMVNNETGAINDVERIGEFCRQKKILFHTDGVQGFGKIAIDLSKLPIDLMSMSAHKLYGPKGVGALFIREGVSVSPVFRGGGQEKNLRPGTENIAGIAGFGLAAQLASRSLSKSASRLNELTTEFLKELNDLDVRFSINGEYQIPGVLNIFFPGVDAQTLVIRMDMAGIAISAGAACSSGTANPSGAVLDMGYDVSRASSSVRISFGKIHTREDIKIVAAELRKIIYPVQKGIDD
ncbi:MAG: cysteine desulfurase family protein [Fidelibacterota bacterium]